MDIKIPILGDGIESAIVISVLVKQGDSVTSDQTLLELETDKAVAPVPAPADGVISSLSIAEGDTVVAGKIIGSISSNGESSAEEAKSEASNQESSPTANVVTTSNVQTPQIVGASTNVLVAQSAAQIINEVPVTSISIKKIAHRLNIDLRYVQGTGKNSRIIESDLVSFLAQLQLNFINPPAISAQGASVTAKFPGIKLPDFTKWGEIENVKCAPLRKKIAEKMAKSWQNVPHVTQQQDIDISDLMQLRKKYNPEYKKKDAKITLTVFVIRAVQKALELFPNFNASYDEENNTLIQKKYIHMGIAVDTENGLIVPVIKNVGNKSILELSQELSLIAQKAKDRTLSVDELQGGTFTISNLGGLGVGAFTPIINVPEVAILGIGAGELKPVIKNKTKIVYRLKMPSCLSYDHRIIDGADGARFIMEIKNQLENFTEDELKEHN
jgi:pyruvate dehydrogenase E2 component (dihydrolipoamide acetyltransferase)